MNENLQTGKLGELYAAQFLISQNYQILAKNFHSRFGEIDIIAIDQNKNQLVFIEVKTRTGDTFGQPEDSFTRTKQLRILKTINHYLNSQTLELKLCWRIDLIALKLNKQLKLLDLKHYKNLSYGN